MPPNPEHSLRPCEPAPKPVRPMLPSPLLADAEPIFSPRKQSLSSDDFDAILQRRDAEFQEQLRSQLEEWMGKLRDMMEASPMAMSTQKSGTHVNGGSPKTVARSSSKKVAVTVRVRTAELPPGRASVSTHLDNFASSQSTQQMAMLQNASFVSQATQESKKFFKATCNCNPRRKAEEGYPGCVRRFLQEIVSSGWFEAFFAVVILTNSVFIAVQVEAAAQNPGVDSVGGFFVIASIYTFLFTFELLLRILAFGLGIFCGEDWMWMLLDFLVVSTSVFEFIIEVMVQNETTAQASDGENTNVFTNMRLLRILRVAKITRAFRIVRLVRFIRSLRTLLLCIGRTLRAMAWSAVLLLLIIFLFGLIFTDICTEALNTEPSELHPDTEIFLEKRCSSLEESMHTLFGSITGGFTWMEARDSFAEISWLFGWLFEVYIAFCNFAVLNVMTGVFCQSAIESAEKDHELNLQNVSAEKEKYFRAVRRLFTTLDQNSDGGITKNEFEQAWDNPVLQTVFDALEISAQDAWQLFTELDSDGSGEVDVDEFLEGCMMLKGPARSIDVVRIKKDLLRLRQRLDYLSPLC